MIEKELKFAITEAEVRVIAGQIMKLGGVLYQPRTREVNTVYDDPVGSCQVQDARLCLQSGANYSLSYERAVCRKGIKQDLVLATRVGSIAQMKKILERIGFKPVSTYVGHRTAWRVGGSQVAIHEFTFGRFLEITGEVHHITKLAQKFGFEIQSNIMATYDDLYRDAITGRAMAINSE